MSKDLRLPGAVGNLGDFEDLKPPPDIEVSEEAILRLWPQAARELAGYANHLERSHAGITADQIRMAVKLANEATSAPYRMMEMDRFLIDFFTELDLLLPTIVRNHMLFVAAGKIISMHVSDNGVTRTLHFENKDFYKFPKQLARDAFEIVKAMRKDNTHEKT
jgi:hypothetical protein